MKRFFGLAMVLGSLAFGSTLLPHPSNYGAVVRGNMTVHSGSTPFGDYLVGGEWIRPGWMNSANVYAGDPIVDWNLVIAQSQYLSALNKTGNVNSPWGGALNFVSDDFSNPVDVFELDAIQLVGITNLNFDSTTISPTTTIIVNILGDAVTMGNAGWNFGQLDPSQLVLNFVNAKSVDLSGIQVLGTIIAPNAAVALSNGTVKGTVIADSLSLTNVQMVDESFKYQMPGWVDVSSSANTPEPSTWAMIAMGAALLAFGTWHRKSSDIA